MKDACELAERLGVENLVLYHTEDRTIERRRELYTEEGSAYSPGNVSAPYPLDPLELCGPGARRGPGTARPVPVTCACPPA